MMDLVTLVLACSLYSDNDIPYAMIQTGSKNNPLVVTVDSEPKRFKNEPEAILYTQKQMAQGKTVNIGIMQVSSQWLPTVGAHVTDLFRPCKNLVVATQIMNKVQLQCQALAKRNPAINIQTCMLSRYKINNTQTGLAYAGTVVDYAKKHPFLPLAKKARDPGMLAATNPKLDLSANAKQTMATDNKSKMLRD